MISLFLFMYLSSTNSYKIYVVDHFKTQQKCEAVGKEIVSQFKQARYLCLSGNTDPITDFRSEKII